MQTTATLSPSRRLPAPGALFELLKPVTWFPPMWAFLCGVVSSGQSVLEHWGLEGYNWAPDGNWISYSCYDPNFNSDIWIVPAAGGDAVNVTRHPDYDYDPVWSADGSMLAWTRPTPRRGSPTSWST